MQPNQIADWKTQLLARAADVFGGEPATAEPPMDLKFLHAKIGQLALENDFLERALIKRRHAERKAMIDPSHDLPIRRQAELVNISCGSAYYKARPVSEGDLELMRRVDELHLELPFAGARMLRDLLGAEGLVVGRKHMTTLMRRMAITALYGKPNSSRKTPGRTIYPYLLRTLPIDRANQIWAMDISHIPMARGFVYLAAVIDWYSRRVLAWRLSISMDAEFCMEAVEEAIARYGMPEIFTTDQGSQFTSAAFTGLLTDHGIRLSMDGKGCWRDNVFIERLWRSIKYEEVYLHAYESVSQARAGIGRYIEFYNTRCPHSSLGAQTPDVVYFQTLPWPSAKAA